MTRVTILGGSAASPNAGMGCAGLLVQTTQATLLLDFGPGTFPELRRHADFRALSAVIISHMHIDHVLDLLALRHALAYNPVPPPRPVPVWLPPGGKEILDRATAPFDTCDEPGRFAATVDVREYDPAQSLHIADTAVTFAPAVHYIPAWAIRIQTPAGDIGYSGDTGPAALLAEFFADVEVLVAEATLLDAGEHDDATRGSLTAAEAGALASASRAGSLVLTHISEERGFDAALQQAATTYTGTIHLARPGLSLTI
jgi:ribonuclease BN (tRNA processing enzyme)